MTEERKAPRTLALVGMPGAGKTLCAQYLEQRSFFQFRFGRIIVDEVIKRGLDVNPTNERTIREEFRRENGMDAIARRALPELRLGLQTHRTIIIDGLYSFSEYKTLLRELGEDMILVAIAAPRHLRYQRLAERPIRPLTPEEAFMRDVTEIETIEKGGPIAIADYTLLNDSTPPALLRQLDALLERLGIYP